jgi:hypothetical protein
MPPRPAAHSRGDWSLFLHVTDEDITPEENANPVTTASAMTPSWRPLEGAGGLPRPG